MDRLLVLVRHGQSEWNLKNLFTGWRDVDLSELGIEGGAERGKEARARADFASTSPIRARSCGRRTP